MGEFLRILRISGRCKTKRNNAWILHDDNIKIFTLISLISRGILTFSVSPENLSFLPVNKCKQKEGKGSLTALLDQTTRIINGHV